MLFIFRKAGTFHRCAASIGGLATEFASEPHAREEARAALGLVHVEVENDRDQEDEALDVLEAMVFALPFRVQYDIWDPAFASLWDSPRFQEVILPRVRLEGAVPSFSPRPEG